ncbi:MAG: guanylate kinase [Holosporales bacterium]|jgi:guanylate kinase|nr:guanylate kinase [Holosporales bacterium]
MNDGLIFAISAPSGAGKTTVAQHLIATIPNVVRSVSLNTRAKRPSEIDGVDYIFVSNEEFDMHIKNENLVEYTEIYTTRCGTPKTQLLQNQQQGIDTICVIERNGTVRLKELFGGSVVAIFLLPPSMEELERRLYARGQDDAEKIRMRLLSAEREMEHAVEYDYCVLNDVLQECLLNVESIVRAERCRNRHQTYLGFTSN